MEPEIFAYLFLGYASVAIGVVLQIVAVFRHREQSTACGIQRNAPLYGIEQEQFRPRFLQQDHLDFMTFKCLHYVFTLFWLPDPERIVGQSWAGSWPT